MNVVYKNILTIDNNKNHKTMSTTYRLFITMAMMAAALSASAQERIDKAIDDFLNDNKTLFTSSRKPKRRSLWLMSTRRHCIVLLIS